MNMFTPKKIESIVIQYILTQDIKSLNEYITRFVNNDFGEKEKFKRSFKFLHDLLIKNQNLMPSISQPVLIAADQVARIRILKENRYNGAEKAVLTKENKRLKLDKQVDLQKIKDRDDTIKILNKNVSILSTAKNQLSTVLNATKKEKDNMRKAVKSINEGLPELLYEETFPISWLSNNIVILSKSEALTDQEKINKRRAIQRVESWKKSAARAIASKIDKTKFFPGCIIEISGCMHHNSDLHNHYKYLLDEIQDQTGVNDKHFSVETNKNDMTRSNNFEDHFVRIRVLNRKKKIYKKII